MKHKLLPLSLLCTLALAACNPPQPAANASETAASSAMTSQPMAASSASMSGKQRVHERQRHARRGQLGF